MNQKIKKSLQSRLRRIEGQARGLQRLIAKDTYCIDVITQAQAIKSAVSAFETAMLKNHLEIHVAHQIHHGKADKAIEEILKVYQLAQK